MAEAAPEQGQGPVTTADEFKQIRDMIDKLYDSVRMKLNALDVEKIKTLIKSQELWSKFGLTEAELKDIKTVRKLVRSLKDFVCLEVERTNLSSCLHNLSLLMHEISRSDIEQLILAAEYNLIQFGYKPLMFGITRTSTQVSFGIQPGLMGIPTEITGPEAREAYKKALEEGSKSVQRTRLMLVGQERVGKTSLMRNLTYQSFNSEEISTEGINTASVCTINVTHAKGWIPHGERDDPASFKSEFVESVAKVWNQNMESNAAEKLSRQFYNMMQMQQAVHDPAGAHNAVSPENAESPQKAVSSPNAVNSQNTVNPQTAVSSQNTVSPQTAMSSQNTVSPQTAVSTPNAVSSPNAVNSQNTVNPQTAVSSQNAVSPQTAVSTPNAVNPPNAVSSRNAVSSQKAVSSPNAVNSQNTVNPQTAVSSQTAVSTPNAVNPPNAVSSRNAVSSQNAVSSRNAVSPQTAVSLQRVSSGDAVLPQDELEPANAEAPQQSPDGTPSPIDPQIAQALTKIRGFPGYNQEEAVLLSIWDFAGQDLYYTTHQTFLSARAVYVVVFNLSHDLEKPIPVPGAEAEMTSCQMTPIQYLDFWMRSVYTYTKENTSKTKNRLEQKSPPIFIVGTHRNSVGGADLPDRERKKIINEIFTRIRKEIYNKPYYRYVVTNFYAIDNSLGYSDEKIEKLREHINEIVCKEPYMGEKIPLHWLQFDKDKLKEVSTRTDHDGTPVLHPEEVRVNSGVKSDTELQTMLAFYHDLGHIVYFGGDGDCKKQELRDVVILDPQWLIDAFKKVITVMPPREQMSGLTKSWQRLKDDGILNDELIDHMWKQFPQKKKPLLCLMDKFDLLCERVHQVDDKVSYYVPSMLQKRTPSASSKTSNEFFVDFESFLPDGLFHRLVVRALRWSQEMGGAHPGLEYYRGSFFVDVQHEFVLQMERKNDLAYIRVSVILAPEHGGKKRRKKEDKVKRRKTPSPEVTKKVLEFVKNQLQNLKDLWIKRIYYSLAFQCPCGRGSIHFLPLDECLEKTSVVCRTEKMPQFVIKTRRFKAMFEQEISAAQDLMDTVDRGPMSDFHLDIIANLLGQEWERLATKFGFKRNDIYKFRENSKYSVHGQIFGMLKAWKQKRQQNVEKMKKELVKALKELDRPEVAREVENYTGAEADTTT